MKVVVQRCKNGKVSINNKLNGKCEFGLMLLVGFTHTDSEEQIDYMIKKITNLRIFEDEFDVMNKSIIDVGGTILSISQFTLYADSTKGNRPSYINAMKPVEATKLYDLFNKKLSEIVHVETGIFGADMNVEFTNFGPCTIILEK